MTYIPEQLGTPDFEGGYVPFVVAAESGVLDLDNLELHTPKEAAEAVSDCRIPKHGGAVYYPGQGIGGVDHQAFRTDGRTIHILPAGKDAVDGETHRIVGEGGTVFTMPDGRIKIAALAVTGNLSGWSRGRNTRILGGVAVTPLGLDSIEGEMTDFDTESGIVVVKRRNPIFSFTSHNRHR